MSNISSLLARLKVESKKTYTKVSKDSDVRYYSDTIELSGATMVMKRVTIENSADYNVGWVMDNQTKSCMRCDTNFSMITWRHHCRSCGFVICTSCGDKKLNFPAFAEESPAGSRVCRPCYNTPIVKTKRKGPPTLVSRTPVVERTGNDLSHDLSKIDCSVEQSLQENPTEISCEPSNSSIIISSTATCDATTDLTHKLYAPKLRPSSNSTLTATTLVPASLPLHSQGSSSTERKDTTTAVVVDLSKALPSTAISHPSTSITSTAATTTSTAHASVDTSNNYHTHHRSLSTVSEAIDEFRPLPIFDDPEQQSSLNSSILSTATKTVRNTAINATLTAPPPKRGQTCTVPEIFSPVLQKTVRDLEYLNLETPPSSGSSGGMGEVQVDFTKFGSPMTRRLIMEDARSNVIWEAADDDISSTNGSSVAPTPTSAISGTTNGGAGVGYIRSPWNNTLSPYGSQQKPLRLLPNTGSSSIGRSGRKRSSSVGRVRFADTSFSTDACADIVCAEAEQYSPALPLTRAQLQYQQEQYRLQQHKQLPYTANTTTNSGVTRLDLSNMMNDVENTNPNGVHTRHLPSDHAQKPVLKGNSLSLYSNEEKVVKPSGVQKEVISASVASEKAALFSTMHSSLPSLNKPKQSGRAPR